MSTVKTNNVQIGQSVTATNNFTWYQPASPDGTVRLGNGNSGSVSDVITVGTTGNLTFANSVSLSAASTKTLTLNGGAGSNGLVLDASNNVGIGTGTPGSGAVNAKFTVEGGRSVFADNSNSYAIGVRYNNSTNGFYIGSPAASTLSFSSWGGTELMRLDSSGNLGLGVTPSNWSGLAGSVLEGLAWAIATLGTNSVSYAQNAVGNGSGAWKYKASYPATQYLQQNGQHYWYNAPSGTAGNAISFTQAMTLDASGNLLVGTTSSSTGNGGFRVKINNSGISGYTNVQAESPTNSNSYSTWDIYAAGAYRFYVGYAGTISAVSTTITGISDQRLKENIRDLDDGLAAILSLKPRKFDWKEGKGKDIKNDRGFIAQEFEQVFPDMIESWADPAPEGEEPYKAVNANLIPTLVKAIQELTTELNELQQKVNA